MSDDFEGTRFNHLDLGQIRDHDRNVGTVFSPLVVSPAPAVVPFEALFLAHYRSIRELARVARPGVGVVAVELGSCLLAGRAWVARRRDRPNVLTIGRHSECDPVLEAPELSLRHVAVVLPRLDRWPAQYALHELRTTVGVRDAIGRPLEAARVEDAGLFRVGPYALFTVATGMPERWPELASDAWSGLAGSVFSRVPAA